MSRNLLLCCSLALGLLSFSMRWIVRAVVGYDAFAFIVLGGAIVIPWLALLIIALWKHGKRGLWLLAGTPLILFWP